MTKSIHVHVAMKCEVSLFTVITLLCSSSFQSSTAAMIVRQPLYKDGATTTLSKAANGMKHMAPDTLQAKWRHEKHAHDFKNKPPNVPIVHIRNQMLYITVSIGTPPQVFKVAVNTGDFTSDFWVISADCTTSQCIQHSRYNHNQSITYLANGQHFTSDLSSGYLSYDTIRLGQTLILNTQDFGEAVQIVGFATFKYDGMLGLGAQPVSNTDSPLLFDLVQQKKIDEPIFGIYLATQNNTAPLLRGELIFGGRDKKHYIDKLSYTKLTNKQRWQIMMDFVSIVNTKNSSTKIACKTGCEAIVDTGTNLIIGPSADVNTLNKELGAVRNSATELSYINCSRVSMLPDVAISIAGQEFVLTRNDYVITLEADTCVSGFVAEDNEFWILGGVFQQVMYIEFDVGKSRIGFAKSLY